MFYYIYYVAWEGSPASKIVQSQLPLIIPTLRLQDRWDNDDDDDVLCVCCPQSSEFSGGKWMRIKRRCQKRMVLPAEPQNLTYITSEELRSQPRLHWI